MSKTAIIVNAIAFACLVISLSRDKEKTKRALLVALKSFFRLLPVVFSIIIIIGLLLGFVPPSRISEIIGEQAGFLGVLYTSILGAILHIPSLISFPLAASLLKGGASITSVAAFITTLTMIGMVTLHLEIKTLGKKFALLRNALAFVFAIIMALIMGALL